MTTIATPIGATSISKDKNLGFFRKEQRKENIQTLIAYLSLEEGVIDMGSIEFKTINPLLSIQEGIEGNKDFVLKILNETDKTDEPLSFGNKPHYTGYDISLLIPRRYYDHISTYLAKSNPVSHLPSDIEPVDQSFINIAEEHVSILICEEDEYGMCPVGCAYLVYQPVGDNKDDYKMLVSRLRITGEEYRTIAINNLKKENYLMEIKTILVLIDILGD